MLIRPAVLNFEKMGFGMFVHFGLYSVHGKGEWAKFCLKIDDESYDAARKQFCPKADWAAELVRTAKDAGCRYITLPVSAVTYPPKPGQKSASIRGQPQNTP